MIEGSHIRMPKPTLSGAAFDALLSALDPDRGTAGERYEVLRQKLVRFFEWRGVRDAETWADEALDRIARRIEAGEQVRDMAGYAAGVARLVWLEAVRSQNRTRDLDEWAAASSPAVEEDEVNDVRLACLDRCLDALPADQRDLVLEYFADERSAKIDRRNQSAARFGIEMNALRIRVHRIRTRLETSVRDCVEQRGDVK